jgi:hypothetical protein
MKLLTCGAVALLIATGCSSSKPADQPPKTQTPAAQPAKESPPAKKDDDEAPAPVETVGSLKEGVELVDAAYQDLAKIVKDGDLGKAHASADRIAKLAAQLPDLATKAGLASADVESLRAAAKDLDALFSPMDQAGDAGNRDLSAKVFAKYETPVTTIKTKAVPAK